MPKSVQDKMGIGFSTVVPTGWNWDIKANLTTQSWGVSYYHNFTVIHWPHSLLIRPVMDYSVCSGSCEVGGGGHLNFTANYYSVLPLGKVSDERVDRRGNCWNRAIRKCSNSLMLHWESLFLCLPTLFSLFFSLTKFLSFFYTVNKKNIMLVFGQTTSIISKELFSVFSVRG